MLRYAGTALLLLASVSSAPAMDQSAIEETNCLMACDANQEHCQSSGPAATRKKPFSRQLFLASGTEVVGHQAHAAVTGTVRARR